MLEHILAGPILRRTTQDKVCVWLALDSEQELSLEILGEKEQPLGQSNLNELETSRFQLGEKLFVYLLRAYPTGTPHFAAGVPLHYRLIHAKTGPVDLHKAKLTYPGHKHPVFHIPERLQSVLHGSCRKPHGDEGIDSLSVGDDMLNSFYLGQDKQRPDVLLLTGDQIYADDVSAALLATLRQQALALTGDSGALPLREGGGQTAPNTLKSLLRTAAKRARKNMKRLLGRPYAVLPTQDALNPGEIPLGGRKDALRNYDSGFSSGEADNHLMSFGEFAAMYLYVFGNARNWTIPQWSEIKPFHVPVEKKEKQQEIEANAQAVQAFGKTLHKVRRLLANIPTYMIFDDHDVTDDWNITGHWYDKVRSSPLGRRIVSNALAAYWAFQAWGNDPDNFDSDMIESITRHLNKSGSDADGDERYDLFTWKHRGWGFSIPTEPPIIAMDSRTQRQPDNPFYPARLMDRYALDWLRVEWIKLKTCEKSCHDAAHSIGEENCPVFIAATPVLGFSPVENLTQFGLWLVGYVENIPAVRFLEDLADASGYLTGKLVDALDAEAWSANLNGFTDFFDTLLHKMHIKRCVFLSGDVHYSFTASGWYKSSAGYTGAETVLHCRQLTSSALRNVPSDSQKQALKELGKLKGGRPSKKGNWWRFYADQWRMRYQLLESPGSDTPVSETCNLGQVLFEGGKPKQHILWHAPDKQTVYDIPPLP